MISLFQMFYKNTTGDPFLLTLPGCIAACPLNQFVRLTKDIVPDNWELECLELDILRNDVLNGKVSSFSFLLMAFTFVEKYLTKKFMFQHFW